MESEINSIPLSRDLDTVAMKEDILPCPSIQTEANFGHD